MRTRRAYLRLRFLTVATLSAALAPTLPAQYGFADLGFPNTTGRGSSNLQCRVYYPSAQSGQNAPILERKGGFPTVVFLHGFLTLGREYPAIGEAFAAAGYVCVLSDTARFSNVTQRDDGVALYPALLTANAGSGLLAGAIDPGRIGLFGYSMGGGNTLEILSQNVGYVCGLCMAPVASPSASKITVPLALIHGEGDTIVPWEPSSQAAYDAATLVRGLRLFYRMNADCTHLNVASLASSSTRDREVWERVLRVTMGFFGRFLRDDSASLERVLGNDARSEARLRALQVTMQTPELWSRSEARIGTDFQISLAGEVGVGALFLGAPGSGIATPFGELLLDAASVVFVRADAIPTSKLLPMFLSIPSDRALISTEFALQGFAQSSDVAPVRGLKLSAIRVRATVKG
ncbi:MAG: hypothetical protein H6832_11560 [Planctomycetes bacterium]|nr:hypothetical protein [Planctomycetota bacterium]MCB9919028.1 hypothetical protein [Planctomycetota bacterium]